MSAAGPSVAVACQACWRCIATTTVCQQPQAAPGRNHPVQHRACLHPLQSPSLLQHILRQLPLQRCQRPHCCCSGTAPPAAATAWLRAMRVWHLRAEVLKQVVLHVDAHAATERVFVDQLEQRLRRQQLCIVGPGVVQDHLQEPGASCGQCPHPVWLARHALQWAAPALHCCKCIGAPGACVRGAPGSEG